MNVCYDKKIAVLYFCIEGEPRLQTRSSRRTGRDWKAPTTVDQRHVIVILVFLFVFVFLPDEPLPCCKYRGSSASSVCARHCLLLCVLVSV